MDKDKHIYLPVSDEVWCRFKYMCDVDDKSARQQLAEWVEEYVKQGGKL